MANLSGPQPDVKYCPACKQTLRNVPRNEMKYRGYVGKNGSISEHTHTYVCLACGTKFEINQDR